MLRALHSPSRSLLFLLLCYGFLSHLSAQQAKPNVLFIAIDDLNDWVSVFGGHPKAKTPNIDRFAENGAVVFQNAHCAGPVCGPSRSAMLSGFMPSRSGAYGNSNNMREAPLVQEYATLPEYFSKNGYLSLSMGKIFHKHDSANGIDAGQWAFDLYEPTRRDSGVDPKRVTSRIQNLINGQVGPPSKHTGTGGTEFAWGAHPTRQGTHQGLPDGDLGGRAIAGIARPAVLHGDRPIPASPALLRAPGILRSLRSER